MENLKEYNVDLFESIRHIDSNGNEYWSARELMRVLEYSKWERFNGVIEKVKISCENSNLNVSEHFPGAGKLSKRGNNTNIIISDYRLSRYACYLIFQNGDSRKQVIALAQTYFAIQTRKQELLEINFITQDIKDYITEKQLMI